MVASTFMVQKIVLLGFCISFLKGITCEEKARIRTKNSINDAHYYESFYWHQIGENPYDDDNWKRVGPKYAIDLLIAIKKTLEELLKAGKITIINIDGPHFQKVLENIQGPEGNKFFNINHYQGNLMIIPNNAPAHYNESSGTQKIKYYTRRIFEELYTLGTWSYQCSQKLISAPLIIGICSIGLVIGIIQYRKYCFHDRKVSQDPP